MHKLGNCSLDMNVCARAHTHCKTSEYAVIKKQTHNGSEVFLVLHVLHHCMVSV